MCVTLVVFSVSVKMVLIGRVGIWRVFSDVALIMRFLHIHGVISVRSLPSLIGGPPSSAVVLTRPRITGGTLIGRRTASHP